MFHSMYFVPVSWRLLLVKFGAIIFCAHSSFPPFVLSLHIQCDGCVWESCAGKHGWGTGITLDTPGTQLPYSNTVVELPFMLLSPELLTCRRKGEDGRLGGVRKWEENGGSGHPLPPLLPGPPFSSHLSPTIPSLFPAVPNL